MASCRNGYLFLYNSIQFCGWLLILISRLVSLDNPRMAQDAEHLLYVFQSLAILEIFHSVSGIVRASPTTTIIQVVSRVQIIFVHNIVSEVKGSSGVAPMVAAWGLVETVRYLYLALNLFQRSPVWLTWLRYSLFYILYPLGVYGEMRVLYDALPYLQERSVVSLELPNCWNFSFSFSSYVSLLLYVIYIPGLYVQYTHMMRQRVKSMGIRSVKDV